MAGNWTAFYGAVCEQAGSIFTGIDEDSRAVIGDMARSSDEFWSGAMVAAFEDIGAESVRPGVVAALEEWRANVLEVLGDLLDLDGDGIGLDDDAIDRLVAAASGS